MNDSVKGHPCKEGEGDPISQNHDESGCADPNHPNTWTYMRGGAIWTVDASTCMYPPSPSAVPPYGVQII
jgi:hypothetical protein